jgi:hypothetical protein
VFIKVLGLFDSFIKYIKFFIKSNCVQEVLSSNKNKYVKELINNDKYLENFLTEKYFKFLPYFGLDDAFGHTSKDILLSIIYSILGIPILVLFRIKIAYKYLYHISLLLSICEKFINFIHELFNLTIKYLNYQQKKKISSESSNIDSNTDDEELQFGEKLTGINFYKLSFQSVLALFDGTTCQMHLNDFQKNLISKQIINQIIEKKSIGFFQSFLAAFTKCMILIL